MRFLLPFLVCACAAASALAQSPKAAVRLDVRNVGSSKTGGSGTYYYWDGYGSYWRDYFRSTQLEADIGTFSAKPLSAKLQWFFIGKRTGSTGQRVLISRGQQKVSVVNGPSIKVRLASEPVRSTEIRSAYYGNRYSSGVKPDGWVVRVMSQEGSELALRASSATLSEFFRNSANVEALIADANANGQDDFDN